MNIANNDIDTAITILFSITSHFVIYVESAVLKDTCEFLIQSGISCSSLHENKFDDNTKAVRFLLSNMKSLGKPLKKHIFFRNKKQY